MSVYFCGVCAQLSVCMCAYFYACGLVRPMLFSFCLLTLGIGVYLRCPSIFVHPSCQRGVDHSTNSTGIVALAAAGSAVSLTCILAPTELIKVSRAFGFL